MRDFRMEFDRLNQAVQEAEARLDESRQNLDHLKKEWSREIGLAHGERPIYKKILAEGEWRGTSHREYQLSSWYSGDISIFSMDPRIEKIVSAMESSHDWLFYLPTGEEIAIRPGDFVVQPSDDPFIPQLIWG